MLQQTFFSAGQLRKALLIAPLFFALGLIPNILKAQPDTLVEVETDLGIITLKLYEETPTHRRNFLRLAASGFYDSLLFHRVIQGFMIQGGDPLSKKAPAGQPLGNGENGYTLPAEIVSGLFHKKGALAAARMGDDVNPQKRSSGCQFYIVQGRTFSESDLKIQQERVNNQSKQALFMQIINRPENTALKNRFIAAQSQQNKDSLITLNAIAERMIASESAAITPFSFSEEQKQLYSSVGGAPHLDGGYTVFGEVLSGLEVIDAIAAQEKTGERPKKDIRMRMKLKVISNKK